MSDIRTFDVEAVKTVVTLRNESGRWDGVRALVEHMMGRAVWSHELPFAISMCQEPLKEQIPDLALLDTASKIAVKAVPGITLHTRALA